MAITLPMGIRVVAGLLGTAIDRISQLPAELPTIGVTLAGQLVKTSMRVQQEVAVLATRGDDLLAGITGGAQENPPWATFDEDDEGDSSAVDPSGDIPVWTSDRPANAPETSVPEPLTTAAPVGGRRPKAAGVPIRPPMAARIGSAPGAEEAAQAAIPSAPATDKAPRPKRVKAATTSAVTGTPGPAAGVDLADGRSIGPDHTLSVAQLKERLMAVDLPVVTALLAQEEAGPQRAAYLTLLSNRVTTLQHEHR